MHHYASPRWLVYIRYKARIGLHLYIHPSWSRSYIENERAEVLRAREKIKPRVASRRVRPFLLYYTRIRYTLTIAIFILFTIGVCMGDDRGGREAVAF